MLKSLTAAIALVAMTVPAVATEDCFNGALMPPPTLSEPSVPWHLLFVGHQDFAKLCRVDVSVAEACSLRKTDASWVIVLRDDVGMDRISCDIRYEKSHMPPNFWYDPLAEQPATIAYMDMLKNEYTPEPD